MNDDDVETARGVCSECGGETFTVVLNVDAPGMALYCADCGADGCVPEGER